jgi:hypothetical protein
MVRNAEANKEVAMSGLRRSISEAIPEASIPIASNPVVTESERLLCAGVTLKTAAKTGMSG